MRKIFLCFLIWVSPAIAKPLVVSTNTILADLVRAVGADAVESACFLPIGLDPHDFEPRPADLRLVAKADLVVVNGFGLENWLSKLVENSGFRGPLVIASKGVPPLHYSPADTSFSLEDTGSHSDEEIDPHAWQDPRNVRLYVENIRDALVRSDPTHAEVYQRNTQAYFLELEKLDHFARDQVNQLPEDRRKLVTSHDALAYLAKAYNLKIVSVSGLHPDREPSAKQLVKLVKFIRSQKVRAVFFEATSNPKFVDLLAKEAGVTNVSELHTDSLGEPGTESSTYLGMVRSNIETIVRALE